ncbi:cupredoxin domain-containing protein [Candidatus Woesearchaeota archaeon]|nr:cupredoxin domain-containing protein [Candidatus Woesearchaeota archaeon]
MAPHRSFAVALLMVFILLVSCSPKEVPSHPPIAEEPVVNETIAQSPIPEEKNESGEKSITILIENERFVPDKISIGPGTTVTWINMDSGRAYKINEKRKLVIGTRMPPGGNFSFTFTQPGTYQIFDSIKNYIRSEVTVKSSDNLAGMATSIEAINSIDSVIPLAVIITGIIPLIFYITKNKEKKKK